MHLWKNRQAAINVLQIVLKIAWRLFRNVGVSRQTFSLPLLPNGSSSRWCFQIMSCRFRAPQVWLWYWSHSECTSNETWLSMIWVRGGVQFSCSSTPFHLEGKVHIPLVVVYHLEDIPRVVITHPCQHHLQGTIFYFPHAVLLSFPPTSLCLCNSFPTNCWSLLSQRQFWALCECIFHFTWE